MGGMGDDGVPEPGHAVKFGEDNRKHSGMVGKEMQNFGPEFFVKWLLMFAIDGHNNFGFLVKFSNLGKERNEIVLKTVDKGGDADAEHWDVVHR